MAKKPRNQITEKPGAQHKPAIPEEVAPASKMVYRFDDCWNKIGIRGNGSCPKLEQYIHCRNCPVFTDAAAELLDGELPDNYIADWTAHFSHAKTADQIGIESVIIFRLGTEWLALSTLLFKEIADLRVIHTLPHRNNDTVLGIVNVRGELLICVALDRTLGIERIAERRRDKRAVQPRLIVLNRDDDRLVFPVDEVYGTYHFHPRDLTPVPTTVANATATYTKAILAWQKRSVGVLDEQLLFYTLNRNLA